MPTTPACRMGRSFTHQLVVLGGAHNTQAKTNECLARDGWHAPARKGRPPSSGVSAQDILKDRGSSCYKSNMPGDLSCGSNLRTVLLGARHCGIST